MSPPEVDMFASRLTHELLRYTSVGGLTQQRKQQMHLFKIKVLIWGMQTLHGAFSCLHWQNSVAESQSGPSSFNM